MLLKSARATGSVVVQNECYLNLSTGTSINMKELDPLVKEESPTKIFFSELSLLVEKGFIEALGINNHFLFFRTGEICSLSDCIKRLKLKG